MRALIGGVRQCETGESAILIIVSRMFKRTGIYLLYRLSLTLAMPFILVYLIGRSLRKPALTSARSENVLDRPATAHISQTGGGAICCTGFGGEVIASVELLTAVSR